MDIVSLKRLSEDFLKDLSKFKVVSLKEVKKEAASYNNEKLREEWEEHGFDIYIKPKYYFYDLWRNINQGTLDFLKPLLLVQNKRILDFGGGAGLVSLLLADKNDVTYYDLEGDLMEFTKFRAKLHNKNIRFLNSLDNVEKEFDLVIAHEVMEHVQDLNLEVSRISKVLDDFGTFYYKNSFGQHYDYPMHFDYTEQWKPALMKYKFNPIQIHLAVKGCFQTKIRSLKTFTKLGTGWHGIINPKSDDPLVAVESRLLREDYDLLLKLYIDLIRETGWKVIIATTTYDNTTTWGLIPAMSGMIKPPHSFFAVTSPLVCHGRNSIVEEALLSGSDWTHLWFIDSDVVPPNPYGLMRLLQRDKDIVNGLYAKKTIPNQWLIWIKGQPVMIADPETPYIIYPEYKDKVLEITGTGAGCLLVKREVFEKIPPPWFKVDYIDGTTEFKGEDSYFFINAKQHGYTSYMDTSVICNHYMNRMVFPTSSISDFQGTASVDVIG